MTAWFLLIAAIVVEVATTAVLPRSDGFTVPGWTAVVLGGYAASIYLLTLVVRSIHVSTAYAVWSGLGTAGIVVVGVLFLGEKMDLVNYAAVGLIITGVLVLNLHRAA